jgi:signal transduction histidine kinase
MSKPKTKSAPRPHEGQDVRLTHLEEMTRFALSALDQAASLSDFPLSMVQLEDPSPILELCLGRVGVLLPFEAMGLMLVDEADSSFGMARCEPPGAEAALRAARDAAIDSGDFAFALREKRAVLLPPRPGQPRTLLHVVTTASRTRGMFVAHIRDAAPHVSEVTLSILSLILGNTAQTLESYYLHQHIKDMNRALESRVECLVTSERSLKLSRDSLDLLVSDKTGELRETLRRLEAEVRQRKKAEKKLEALNQRLEAKVEARNKALVRKVAELEEANRQLTQLERLKSAFLSSVSHELRTPLTSILGFAKLIARDFDRHFQPGAESPMALKAGRIMRNLGIVEQESERLTRLINDVLDLSRIESGRMVWRDDMIDLRDAAAAAARAVEGRLANRPGVELTVEMPRSLPRVLADRDRVIQVVINLLDNALKFTDEGFVFMEAGLSPEGMVMLCVEDTGPGVSPDEAEKIFDKFHQHDRADTLKDKPVGTGLGLAICRHIVKRYGGRIWWEQGRHGGGSCFCFTLPPAEDPCPADERDQG